MSERLVHLIDSDRALAAQVAATLHSRGLRVAVFADGNDALSAREVPQLVILCIDPKRLGWAICNRMKKSPALKTVPLIVTSGEATEKDFEDHRALRNRADDYLHKPFAIEALVEKVSALLGGIEPAPRTDNDAIEIPIGDEIAIEDDLAVEVELDESGAHPRGPVEDRTSVSGPSPPSPGRAPPSDMPEIPEVMDPDEAEAAFDAISVSVPMPRAPEAPPAATAKVEDTTAVTAVPVRAAPPAPAPAAAAPAPVATASAATRTAGPDLGFDEVAVRAPSKPAPSRAAATDEVQRLQDEVARLQREIEDARARKSEGSSYTTFSREREFLNLREVINKKEKELLDLRDSVDAKDRQVLDLRDKMREAERARRDIDEKMLALEREAVSGRERAAALARDKETALQRELGLKARLDEASKKLAAADVEIDDWKNRHRDDLDAAISAAGAAQAKAEAELAALRSELAQKSSDYEKTIRDTKQKLAAEQAQTQALKLLAMESEERSAASQSNLQRKHDHAVAEKDRAHAEELQKVRSAQSEIVAVAEQRARDQLGAAEDRHRSELTSLSQNQADELFRRDADHKRALELATAEHARELAELRQSHDRAIQDGEQERASSLHAADERRIAVEQALADERARVQQLASEIDRLRGEHDDRVAQLDKAHHELVDDLHEKMAEAEARHEFDKEELSNLHQSSQEERERKLATDHRAALEAERRERENAAARAGVLEEELTEKDRDLGSAKAQIAGLLADLASSSQQLAERDRLLDERDARIADLEGDAQRLQEQVLGAVQRLKSDEVVVERAKKALAIALSLLDGERG